MNYVFVYRGWQSLAGLLAVIVIASFLSAEQQGWYYSFQSIAAVSTLFDYGLSLVLIQTYAYHVSKNKVELVSLIFKKCLKRYIILSGTFLLVTTFAGFIFFCQKSGYTPEDWRVIWALLVFMTSLNLLIMPVFAYFEGVGLLAQVYKFRTIHSIINIMFLSFVLYFGGKLWAVLVMPTTSLLSSLALIYFEKDNLNRITQIDTSTTKLNWKLEVGNHQIKLGISLLSGFLLTQIYTPFIFNQFGAVAAGQFALTLTLVNMIGLISQSFITSKIPHMSGLAANDQHLELRIFFERTCIKMITFYILGSIGFLSIQRFFSELVIFQRFMPTNVILAMLLGGLSNQIIIALSAHIRSYRLEPFMWLNVVSVLITSLLVISFSKIVGVYGVAYGIVLIQVFFSLPLGIKIWRKSLFK